MKVKNAELLISAVKEEQYPESDLPEFVLLGRSNVGKSSFINALINRKNLARTSSQPGKTQTMNFYEVEAEPGKFVFVDMPGYGYAKVSKKEREKWGKMIETYLQNRDKISNVFLLVDSRVGPTEDDQLMYDWLTYYDMHPTVVATKTDKLSSNKLAQSKKKILNTLELDPKDLILYSAEKKRGQDEVWDLIVPEIEPKNL